jgi:hypothetical protein
MKTLQTSYKGLFTQVFDDEIRISRVEVPILQRDFAQGRLDTRTTRVRESFLDAIVAAITDGPPLSLDFVYGDVQGDTLLPLDGQQRLTTLFLLHWYVAARCGRLDASLPWLRLTYATRPGARTFCRQLAKAQPALNDDVMPSEWITDQPWFLEAWRDDPTIESMLVVLDHIHRKLRGADIARAWHRLIDDPAITFHVLPLKSMGLGDDIYIKMNSRGKPLTEFELFKARFERLLESSSESSARYFAERVDVEWADVFWRPDAPEGAMDSAMVRYIRYLTDLCIWRAGEVANPFQDLETTALRVYGSDNHAAADNVKSLITGLDAWVGVDTGAWFSRWLVSQHADGGVGAGRILPLRLFRSADRGDCDLFAACCNGYGPRARDRDFGMPDVLMLYALLLQRWTDPEGSGDTAAIGRRLRIVRNLTEGSEDELRAERMPNLLGDVRRIIVDDSLDDLSGFNLRVQGADERAKRLFLREHPTLESIVFELEDHPLLRGCLAAFELDENTLPRRARAFAKLFADDALFSLITGALLAAGDYSIRIRGRFFLLGSPRNPLPWREVFTSTAREELGRTRAALGRLLDHIDARAGVALADALHEFVSTFLTQCAEDSRLDWRYYFVKYSVMREGASGRYVGMDGQLGYSVCMLNKQQMNSYYRDPYLHAVRHKSGAAAAIHDTEFTGYESLPRWMRLKRSDIAVRAIPEGFSVKTPSKEFDEQASFVLSAHGAVRTDEGWLLAIPQVSKDGELVDTADRVELGAALLRDLVQAGY